MISKGERDFIKAEDILRAAEEVGVPISNEDKVALERLGPMVLDDFESLLDEKDGRE